MLTKKEIFENDIIWLKQHKIFHLRKESAVKLKKVTAKIFYWSAKDLDVFSYLSMPLARQRSAYMLAIVVSFQIC